VEKKHVSVKVMLKVGKIGYIFGGKIKESKVNVIIFTKRLFYSIIIILVILNGKANFLHRRRRILCRR